MTAYAHGLSSVFICALPHPTQSMLSLLPCCIHSPILPVYPLSHALCTFPPHTYAICTPPIYPLFHPICTSPIYPLSHPKCTPPYSPYYPLSHPIRTRRLSRARRFIPGRLHCVRALMRIGRAGEVQVPSASLVLDVCAADEHYDQAWCRRRHAHRR